MYNVLEYKEGVSFFGSFCRLENKVEMARDVRQVLSLWHRRHLKNDGMAVLHFVQSDRQFAKGGINNGERFPYKYDRRHNINLTINHKFSDVSTSVLLGVYTGGTSTIH